MDKSGALEVKPMDATTITPQIVDVIDKRVLAKTIVSLCGNEGTKDDVYNAVLRRLLQHAISVIGDETETTLKNAEFKFYDDKCKIHIFQSGDGENKFMFTYNEKLEPVVIIHRKTRIRRTCDSLRRKMKCIPNALDWWFDSLNDFDWH